MAENRVGWRQEMSDLLRGLAGGFIFSSPLIYTMEVWWKGDYASPLQMGGGLVIMFASLCLLNIAGGFREEKQGSTLRVAADSAKGVVLALAGAAATLFFIGMLKPGHGLRPLFGRIIMEAIPFAVGIGISDFILKPSEEGGEGRVSGNGDKAQVKSATVADAGATILGAVLISSSIAPTEEVPLIAAGLGWKGLLLLVAASLVISYVIVFEAEFISQEVRHRQQGMFQRPFAETAFSYLLSLCVAAAMLWLFQNVAMDDPFEKWVEYSIVLGFPAAVGGAAGRLAI